MNNQDLIYRIGLTLIKGIGLVRAKQIVEKLGDASVVFTEKSRSLKLLPWITRQILAEIHQPEVLRRAEQEAAFVEKNKITTVFLTDKAYPQRMIDCPDAPILLYFKGKIDWNEQKTISIVGTRKASSYGKAMTDALIKGIAEICPDALIVSGLAYGIDICAHQAALKYGLPTVAVLAHGLDRIYPHAHRNVAVEMLNRGGLLTEFMSETNPDAFNFVKRNRIVAGISDCSVIVESSEKGGSLITASIASSYNKDVLAVPGRATDQSSSGCNALIMNKTAAMVTCAEDIFREMCWDETDKKRKPAVQRALFPDLTPNEQAIMELLSKKGAIQKNTLCIDLDMPVSQIAPLLFDLEMKGAVRCVPGGVYQLA